MLSDLLQSVSNVYADLFSQLLLPEDLQLRTKLLSSVVDGIRAPKYAFIFQPTEELLIYRQYATIRRLNFHGHKPNFDARSHD